MLQRTPFHCYGRGASAHALPGGEMHPSTSLRQGCGRDRKTHNVKAATFARSAGGKPEYQQVYSSALYGRDAMKDFDDYIRTSHRAAAEHGQDPLTRVKPDRPQFMLDLVAVTEASDGWQVAWPAQGKTTTGEDVAHSYHQIQRQNNEKALGELDHWADLHDDATQKWLERWQRRQHDDLAA